MSDDGIRERHGVLGFEQMATHQRPRAILLREHDETVGVVIDNEERRLSPDQTRYLARQLNRLARRIEGRSE